MASGKHEQEEYETRGDRYITQFGHKHFHGRGGTKVSTITEHEVAQVERANASGATPVDFVHGLWLLPRASRFGHTNVCPASVLRRSCFSTFHWSLTTSPLDHRQGVERVLPKLINRQLNEPSMEARVRPPGGDSRDGRARKAEPS